MTNAEICAHLVAMRKEAGLSAAALAKTLNLSKVTLHNFETGTAVPSTEVIAAWAQACGYEMVLSFRSLAPER